MKQTSIANETSEILAIPSHNKTGDTMSNYTTKYKMDGRGNLSRTKIRGQCVHFENVLLYESGLNSK